MDKASPEDVPIARHAGELWPILQEIAKEEDPRFETKAVVEHFRESAEALKDVRRWLEVYQKRINPEHDFRFPPHHPRHRGCCLMARNWPTGIRWEAFDDETLLRLPIPGQADKESLVVQVDEFLDGKS